MTRDEENLKEIAEWLKDIEHIAGVTYKSAAARLDGDSKLKSFLKHLSEDEAWHFHVMGSAAEYFSSNGGKTGITLDESMKSKIESPFIAIKEMLRSDDVSEEALLSHIMEAEISEWNDFFLYVVNTLKEKSYEFAHGVAKIQQHMNYLENQITQFPDCVPCQEMVKKLSTVWEEKVLIVEDDPALVTLLQAVLSKEYEIEIARNGKQALDLIQEAYFDLVISDIRMPTLDGIGLYNEVEKINPELANRFIYYATAPDTEEQDFIRDRGIRLVLKPSSLNTIRQAVREMLVKQT